jgi:hypothetical protein
MSFPDNYTYPRNLAESGSNYIQLTAMDKEGDPYGTVSLYAPPNLSWADGAGFSTFDMGPLGNAIAAGMSGGLNTESAIGLGKEMAGRVSENQDLRTIMAGKMIQNAAAVPGLDRAADIYQKSKSIAMNPNTVTSFQNMNMRTFVFNFKMVAESQEESATIKQIQNFIRTYMYASAGSGGYLLSYPAKWDIKFMLGGSSKENPYLPRIYECYLTNFQTTFNSSSHLTFVDGAPTEVDVSITFQETRVLTQNDMVGLL